MVCAIVDKSNVMLEQVYMDSFWEFVGGLTIGRTNNPLNQVMNAIIMNALNKVNRFALFLSLWTFGHHMGRMSHNFWQILVCTNLMNIKQHKFKNK